ncbi:Zinc transporter [Coemansia javaensis]|uniref:Zinc transporter n=1 Tax=Coemansia javaensis TaxID=2761396 RepID=A0A9W8LF37_9FUNG|nr:Zinc transporter [Coemansia javaensis]
MAGSASQAWLFAMTSGLASALGGAALYVDPVLRACGAPRTVNVLGSHAVLSATLAGASGAMAYTSIGVLTRESIEHLAACAAWPAVRRHPGAVAAALFIAGALLNLLLARAVERATPRGSPIKHACASHPPSPGGPLPAAAAAAAAAAAEPAWRAAQRSDTLRPSGSYGEQPPHSAYGEQPPHSAYGEQPPHSAYGGEHRLHSAYGERQPLLLPRAVAHNPGSLDRWHHPAGTPPSDYACTSPQCYSVEHCHITPLYPHVHARGGASHGARHGGTGDNGPDNGPNNGPDNGPGGGGRTRRYSDDGNDDDGCSHIRGCGPVAEPEALSQQEEEEEEAPRPISERHQRLLIRVGLQTAVAIGLHKVPEGLIIYLSRQASPRLGVSVAASLFFHNLPEGLMMALPLFLATGRRHTAFAVAALTGAVPPALGAALGMLAVGDGARDAAWLAGVFGTAFGVIAGMLCMVALNGMLPTARIYDRTGNVVACCFALGVAAMLAANAPAPE